MSCKWNGSGNPRTIVGRHDDDCSRDECAGCQPCIEPHCRICGIAHSEGACAECLAEARGNLHEIARMCDSLPDEVEHRGTDGEAMMLLGPVADPEARGHLEASIAAGRVPADYLEAADSDQHPLFVLGSWDSVWRDALEHDEAETLTLVGAVDYLDRTMTYMGGYEHVPFEDFARDLRRCVAHLEAVLHDGEQLDRGAPCMKCGRPLTRTWGAEEKADGWECRRCREQSTAAQYQLAVKADYIRQAEWLTDADCVTRIQNERTEPGDPFSTATIRSWATKGKVEKRRHSERTEYRVSDVLRHAIAQAVA